MKAQRVSNWPAALERFVQAKASVPFAWGTNDCCTFTCDAILAITGLDLAADLRGTYSNAISGCVVMEGLGGVEALADNRVKAQGWPRIAVSFAGRGDVVCLDMDERPTLGVCLGMVAAFAGPSGLVTHPTLNARAAWRIA